jgi:hypothetical protein
LSEGVVVRQPRIRVERGRQVVGEHCFDGAKLRLYVSAARGEREDRLNLLDGFVEQLAAGRWK